MAREYHKWVFTPKNPRKYIGNYPIIARSRWEAMYMQKLDAWPDVIDWAWEPVKIPYRDPLTGKQKIYIPDCLVTVIDRDRQARKMLVEIKPGHEAFETLARSTTDALLVAKNRAKWAAAAWWCMRRGIAFVIMTEAELFDQKPSVGKTTLINPLAPKRGQKKGVRKRKPKLKAGVIGDKLKKAANKTKNVIASAPPPRPARPKRPKPPSRPKRGMR